jgi:Cd2+/Zn2+-exporting ATPase
MINIGQTQLVVKTTSAVEDSAVSRLIRLIEEAQSNHSPTEKMIDSFVRSYTPTVMVMASLMCTFPWAFGADVDRHWMLNGLNIVVIACPCALTISTPVTYAAGLAANAQQGIIIKDGSKLEAMGSVDCIVFDKTGTLMKGTFAVTHLEATAKSKT